MNDFYSCSPKQAKVFVEKCIKAGLVPNLIGSPGIGKSSIVRQIANEYNLEVIDIRLSMCDPTDMQGIPFISEGKARWTPFNDFPIETSKLPKDKNGWILFLDEFNAAPRSVQAAAYKLVLDRMVGMHKLHPNCAVVTAGNLSTDRSITVELSTAMKSRLIHINMEVNFDDWIKDVAIKKKFDKRIIAYLHMYKHKLMDFDPDRDDLTFACPRTWEFANNLLKDVPNIDEQMTKLLAGTIGSGIACEFAQFTKVFDKIPKIGDIILKPQETIIPDDAASKWAIITSLVDHTDHETVNAITTYVQRFDDVGFIILYYTSIIQKDPTLITSKEVREKISGISKYLWDTSDDTF